MTIILHELKANVKTTFVWICSLVLLLGLFLAMFPGFSKEAESMQELLNTIPEGLRMALGIQLSTFTSLEGFYSYVFIYIALCGAIQAMYLGFSSFAKESQSQTIDFLFSKPLSRKDVIVAKSISSLLLIVVTNACFFPLSMLLAEMVKVEPYSKLVVSLISLSLLFIQFMFLCIGLTFGLIWSHPPAILSVVLATVFGIFFLGMFGSGLEEPIIRYFVPFQYFNYPDIISSQTYSSHLLP